MSFSNASYEIDLIIIAISIINICSFKYVLAFVKYGTNRVPYWFDTGRIILLLNTGRFRILRDGWQH